MRRILFLTCVLPLAVILVACSGSTPGGGDKTQVVASFYPFAYVAEQVGGSLADVASLTSPGVEPHDLELRPKQVATLQGAALVIYEKNFQAAVDQAVDQAGRSSKDTLDIAQTLQREQARGGDKRGGRDQANEDPHTWLDPRNMIAVTEAVQQKLAAIDPEHASTYAANAARFVAELSSLDQDFVAGLQNCRTDTIVTSHAAFQYLADRYGLKQIPIAGIDPSNEPSPSQLADITSLVRSRNITTIFTEELVSPAIADTIASETGARTATLDPIEGLSDATQGETYLTLMRMNLQTLRKANSCP
ncbi:metal ABC transporter substrate-binding protein [Aeromicrobium sp.]|uniref:metal ABC transporter substrate-binding protein n=1 Tax=Aeromicrobium sp. TaxID=1871063 RepID=UPI003C4C4309